MLTKVTESSGNFSCTGRHLLKHFFLLTNNYLRENRLKQDKKFNLTNMLSLATNTTEVVKLFTRKKWNTAKVLTPAAHSRSFQLVTESEMMLQN